MITKKFAVLKCRLPLILRKKNDPFLDRIALSQLAMFGSVVGPRSSPTTLPKDKFVTKEKLWRPFSGSRPVSSITASWILLKSSRLRSIVNKSTKCTWNFNTCAWLWSKETDQYFSTTTLDRTLNMRPNRRTSRLRTTTFSSIWTIFYWENTSKNQDDTGYRHKKTYFSLAKCIDSNSSYFD